MDEEIDKTSMKYFMTQMTQQEFDEIIKYRPNSNSDFETGWNRDERYVMNKIRSEYLDRLDKENG